MDYNIEALGDERFQKLCQAILVATFPNVQCLPVGQPDGGRDALARGDAGFIVYQVKFSKNPTGKDERKVIEDVIATEQDKVSKLIKRGATAYYLITNVAGTAHLDTGSIDRTNAKLTEKFGIPTTCWWRDDIERRIDAIEGLVWRYPEIIRATDFLEKLTTVDPNGESAHSTYRLYVAAQFEKEKEVKFQQVQIQNNLTDLFTDIPIGSARDRQPSPDVIGLNPQNAQIANSFVEERLHQYPEAGRYNALAANWLLRCAPNNKVQRIVLEGAPGQGKSTVTQYISQYYRSNVIDRKFPTSEVLSLQDVIVRLPIRVDLRDYAAWLLGYDPFALQKNHARPESSTDSLESYISYQIHHVSGGQGFSVERLVMLLRDAHCLLVLDGFDEVADIPTRNRLIDQIRQSCSRLENIVRSAQIIVTSRPSAFILSGGFPEREWAHWSLRPMKVEQISEYADKWIAAKNLSHRDGSDFKQLLLDRISRPHIRSLAQNPMQLAILLNLINTKGRSLPDKRTALYDSYIDLFFGREAEKDEVVRENREILIQIHQYIAWLLQTDAETPGGAGSITEAGLRETVEAFLTAKGHDADVMKLFQGAIERVGALVSRVQGMLEFEVQPLREYFAGVFLYQTAPYSTLTSERGGSRPQRFKALARRPYWSNVARFFAGCYNSGELASLLACLEEVHQEQNLKNTAHALQLALLLLSDWVFSQEPMVVRMVVDFVSRDENLRVISASRSSWEDSRLSLPARCGQHELGEAALGVALTSCDRDFIRRTSMIARSNLSPDLIYRAWKLLPENDPLLEERTLSLGVFETANVDEREEMFQRFGDQFAAEIIQRGDWSTLRPEQLERALRSVAVQLPDREWAPIRFSRAGKNVAFQRMYLMLVPSTFRLLDVYSDSPATFAGVISNYGYAASAIVDDAEEDFQSTGYSDFAAATRRSALVTIDRWGGSLEPWNDIIESARRTWGDTTPITTLAAMAAGIRSRDVRSTQYDHLFDEAAPLAERVRHARLKASPSWWMRMYHDAACDEHRLLWCLVALSWSSAAVLRAISPEIDAILSNLTEDEFGAFYEATYCVSAFNPGSAGSITSANVPEIISGRSNRFDIIICRRFSQNTSANLLREIMSSYSENDTVVIRNLFKFSFQQTNIDQKFWPIALDFFEKFRAQLAGDDYYYSSYYFGRVSSIPTTIAERIMADLKTFPLSLIEAAEFSLNRRASGGRRTMREVADQENWFAGARPGIEDSPGSLALKRGSSPSSR